MGYSIWDGRLRENARVKHNTWVSISYCIAFRLDTYLILNSRASTSFFLCMPLHAASYELHCTIHLTHFFEVQIIAE